MAEAESGHLLPPPITENLQAKKERKEMTESLMGKAVDILTVSGQPVGYTFGDRIKKQILLGMGFSPFPLTGREISDGHSIKRPFRDEEGNSIDITVRSYGKKEPSQSRAYSVNVPGMTEDGLDTLLLVRRGEKEVVSKIWNGKHNSYWELRDPSQEELKACHQVLSMLT